VLKVIIGIILIIILISISLLIIADVAVSLTGYYMFKNKRYLESYIPTLIKSLKRKKVNISIKKE
jgi:uncharacterized protein YxeA